MIQDFIRQHPKARPIVMAEDGMLSKENRENWLIKVQYIVGARLANAPLVFIDTIIKERPRMDEVVIRPSYPNRDYQVICSYSQRRAKKD